MSGVATLIAAAPQVTAAWIAAVFVVITSGVNLVVTLVTRAQDRSARAEDRRQDVAESRREAADRQRREVFATFVLSCEELADRLRRAIHLGEIAKYVAGRDIANELAKATGEELTLPENPMPELEGTPEASTLTDLGIRIRAWRGMVEIIGPPSVGDAARTYEHHLNIATELLIARDLDAASSFTDDVPTSRAGFIAAARDALDPKTPMTRYGGV